MRHTLVLGALALLLSSCVSGRITSSKDPFYTGGPKQRFLFLMETKTLSFMKAMESYADEAFTKRNLVAVPLSTAIPPVREYTDAEKAELLRKADVQAYVRMRMSGVDQATINIPSISYSQGSASAYGNTAQGRGSTVTAGGYAQNIVTGLSFACEVQDAVTLTTIWKGDIEIDVNQRNQYIPESEYYYKAVRLLVERLQADGIASRSGS